jgi:hypothetical protein
MVICTPIRTLAAFSGHTSADSEAKFHDLHMKMTFCRQSQEAQKRERYRANVPVESIEDHYRVNYFFLFIDHTFFIISHLNSRFIDFYIIEMLYIPITIATNSDHAVEMHLW